jgi:hypothetical protein
MDWGSGDLWGTIASAGGGLISSWLASDAQKSAASDASGASAQGAQMGIDEQRRQFDAIQKLLSPWVSAGTGALGSQKDLLGINGPEAQQAALDAIQKSPEFTSMMNQGENAILQNASATGGLRGGNTQAALAEFRPKVLSSLIESKFGKLGALSSMGETAAGNQALLGGQTGANVSNLMGRIGSANAGNALAQGQANAKLWNGVAGTLGYLAGSQF